MLVWRSKPYWKRVGSNASKEATPKRKRDDVDNNFLHMQTMMTIDVKRPEKGTSDVQSTCQQ